MLETYVMNKIPEDKRKLLVDEISNVINRLSLEGTCNTPDFILAEHMTLSLEVFISTTTTLNNWKLPPEEIYSSP